MSELRTNRIVPRDGLTSGSYGGIIQVRYGSTTSTQVTQGNTSGAYTNISEQVYLLLQLDLIV